MDQQTAEVITIAIEQQKQNAAEISLEEARRSSEQAKAAPPTEKSVADGVPTNDEEIQQLAEQVQSSNGGEGLFELSEEAKNAVKLQQSGNGDAKNGAGELPRDAAHKNFSVDPSLKVASGLVADITGPKLTQNDTVTHHITHDHNNLTNCTRCKKEFSIPLGTRPYKLCEHCRELQRQRSRKWQHKIKEQSNTCRRCGAGMETQDSKFVLCAPCRLSLRARKANRYQTGKCVHCSGVNDSTQYKVCSRCRENDKQRRLKLEGEGRCNRCAGALTDIDASHKVCYDCRTKKKRFTKGSTDAAAAAAAAAAHRAVQPLHGALHDLRTQVQDTEPSTEASNEIYQQQVAQQLEANLFASRSQQAQAEVAAGNEDGSAV